MTSRSDPGASAVTGLTVEDAVAVTELRAACEAVDRTGEHSGVEDVVEELGHPGVDPARDLLGVRADEELIAYAGLMPRGESDAGLRLYTHGCVHPAHRGRGLGTMLMTTLLQRAAERAAERELAADLVAGVPSHQEDALAVHREHGFEPFRFSFDMEVAVTGRVPSGVALPEGYRAEPYAAEWSRRLLDTHNAAFEGYPGFTAWSPEDWAQRVTDSRSFRPDHTLLALDEDAAIAAYVQSHAYDAHEAATGQRQLYVHRVGTHPAHRGRGLASALLERVLDQAAAAGFDSVGLDVDTENPTGALGIYERAGFVVTHRWTTLRRVLAAS